jgi:hypothetical protein
MEKSGGDITEGQANEDAPFGQIEAHPLRVQDEHGMLLSHFNLSLAVLLVRWMVKDGGRDTDRLHSAHAMAPCERFHSRSLYLPGFAASLRPVGRVCMKREYPTA